MSENNDWSPDEPLGTEAFEQGDEALDEGSRIDSNFIEELEEDPSLDPTLKADERELEEIGAEFDDPDGLGEPTRRTRARGEDQDGWELDAPEVSGKQTDGDLN